MTQRGDAGPAARDRGRQRGLLDAVNVVYPTERIDVEHARPQMTAAGVSSRDVIHVAIMRRHGVDQILKFDLAFERIEGIEHIREESASAPTSWARDVRPRCRQAAGW